jgi:steroid 5-alpha reductase family enzyme
MPQDWIPPLLVLAAASLAMAAVWLVQRRTGNAGWVDVVWSFGLGASALVHALVLDGWLPRRLLVLGLVLATSLRLGTHLAKRVSSEHEDGRYAALRASLGERAQGFLLLFFLAQAVTLPVLSLAWLVPMRAAEPGWRLLDLAGVLLWIAAWSGETIADRQLARWRADPANRGKTCREGLWAFSRHPNYFFQWLGWIGWAVLALGLPGWWMAWIPPALLLFLLLRVTGIPPTERQALRSRGEDYRRYQRETNAFFPGPRRAAAEASA